MANPYPDCPVPDAINPDHSGGGELGALYNQDRLQPISARLVELGEDPADVSEGYACEACYDALGIPHGGVAISWPF